MQLATQTTASIFPSSRRSASISGQTFRVWPEFGQTLPSRTGRQLASPPHGSSFRGAPPHPASSLADKRPASQSRFMVRPPCAARSLPLSLSAHGKLELAEWESMPEDEPGELEPSGCYALAVSMAEGTVSEVPGCADLVIDLDGLWA